VLAVLAAMLIAGVAGLVALAPRKTFSLPRVHVDATLERDGTLRIAERITYRFAGSFSYGTRPIPVGPYTISDMRVTERGRELPSEGAPHNLRWRFSARDEQRTFTIAYTGSGAVPAGTDVAEVYWKWVGEDHPTIGLVTARLRVPPGPGRLRAWGHGPLSGVVRTGADEVRWRAPQVPTGTFVEGRVAVPVGRLAVAAGPEPRLGRILAEERAWAAAANAQRRAEAAEADRRRRDRRLAAVLAALVAPVAAAGFVLLWRRSGREPPRPAEVGDYLRDLPDDPPAVVDALLHWGSVRPNAFAATVVDLAQRGALRIRAEHEDRVLLPDRVDHVLTRTDHPDTDLAPFERAALDVLFAWGPEVRQRDLVRLARSDQAAATARWKAFQRAVDAEVRRRRYLAGGRAGPFAANLALAAASGAAGWLALRTGAFVPGAVALVWGAVQAGGTLALRQRTPAGARRYHEWLAVRRFLRDFSELADAPAGHLVLWERYLVYAVALGVADELGRALALRAPELAERSDFAAWYRSDTGGFTPASLGSFSAALAGTASAAGTPPSSGSGGGGGFSGGGGGGGGGGGIGAG
jgi:hypothetical protein